MGWAFDRHQPAPPIIVRTPVRAGTLRASMPAHGFRDDARASRDWLHQNTE
jgi:hypothetical protein